jgi:beta-lactamase regulating signal transducer with metallopeptidase domain
MNIVAQFARTWLDWTIAISWQIGVLVCLIAVLTYALCGASPRLRYGLWLLVLVKAFLPPTLGAFWAVGAWGVAPIVSMNQAVTPSSVSTAGHIAESGELGAPIAAEPAPAREIISSRWFAAGPLLVAWAAGCLLLWAAVAWRYSRLVQATNSMRRIDEGPVRVELERLAHRFGIRNVPELLATELSISPMLVGVLRPKIVLPETILTRLSGDEVRMILAHELMHWRRHDTWVGWLQVFVQGVFWFHPLVWVANSRIREERECACDETVLRDDRCDRDEYGETIIRVLTTARGRSLAMANMVGIFERGSRLQTRLEEIMSFDPKKRRFGWLSRTALVVAALVLLPMAAPSAQAQREEQPMADADDTASADAEDTGAGARRPTNRPRTNWPTIVATTPEIGATEVDPSIKEISVTFDRDMERSGYSWTGGGPSFPPSPEGAGATWIDERTCVLPVQLKRGSFYRIGINSSDHQNFRSATGVPAETAAIYFATRGAPRGVASRVRVPKVVECEPQNGATDVDPTLKMLRVTFNMPMDTSSFSWTGGGPTFPTIPQGAKASWSRDGRTALLPVKLERGKQYELGLNSVSHKSFASKWGVPLAPVRYEFSTTGEAGDDGAEAADVADNAAPRIVEMEPENGATDVDPNLKALRVTFDRPMAGGFSWTGGGEQFPKIPAGKKPRWSADQKTCTLPVELQPGKAYRLGLNSPSFKNFASAKGVPLDPVVYEFRTSPANE